MIMGSDNYNIEYVIVEIRWLYLGERNILVDIMKVIKGLMNKWSIIQEKLVVLEAIV